MRIASFTRHDMLNNPGSNKLAFTIWFSGCSMKCKGCHNEALWDKNGGMEYSIGEIAKMIPNNKCDVVLLGGEPLEQELGELGNLIHVLDSREHRVWLYTSKEASDIPEFISDHCYFIKSGRWIESLATGGFPASSNQKVWRRDNRPIEGTLYTISSNGTVTSRYGKDVYVNRESTGREYVKIYMTGNKRVIKRYINELIEETFKIGEDIILCK